MKKITFFLLCLLACNSVAFSQGSIQGEVRDKKTKESIVGANVYILGTTIGKSTNLDGFYNIEYGKPITIGNGVWLAAGVIICGGVHIGDDVVIAAGSVVTRDIPSHSLAAGVPCKVIRPLSEKDRMFSENERLKTHTD